ncbi:MAG: branched-chain amino acid aminotransferase [Deltaproteobacteria bacterium]|nr:branched-chain amino acid aminotransferase [Deltaproteobacteria bacterium]
MKIEIDAVKSSSASQIARKLKGLHFGREFSDRMFLADWSERRGWHAPRVVAHGPLTLDPAANVLHYAQQVFEGLKAHRLKDGGIAIFRPNMHALRFDCSAERLCMPPVGTELFGAAVDTLVDLERRWVPPSGAGALYIRPTLIATEAVLGVRVSSTYLFFVIVGPVGPYFPNGFKPVKIYVEQSYVRSTPGSIGFAKSAGNYAASLLAGRHAYERGCDQVLFLDAKEHRYLEELGGMNVFAVIDGVLTTPPLSGSILPGVTRATILELAPRLGLEARERPIALDEITRGLEHGRVTEMFAVGTAAVVTAIGKLVVGDQTHTVHHGGVGKIAQTLYDRLTGIHTGVIPDTDGWMHEVREHRPRPTRGRGTGGGGGERRGSRGAGIKKR